jgi:hypothetical protein
MQSATANAFPPVPELFEGEIDRWDRSHCGGNLVAVTCRPYPQGFRDHRGGKRLIDNRSPWKPYEHPMRPRTALTNGLLYGCGGAPPLAATGLLFNADFSERALTGALLGLVLSANLLFLIAYCVHPQTAADVVGPCAPPPASKRVACYCGRAAGGLLLGTYVAGLVFLLECASLVEVYGGVYEYLTFAAADDPARHHYLELYTTSGAAAGALGAGLLGVVLAPIWYGGRRVLRSGLIASVLGFVAGAFAAAPPGLFAKNMIPDTDGLSYPVILGAMTGSAAAVVLARWAGRRTARD